MKYMQIRAYKSLCSFYLLKDFENIIYAGRWYELLSKCIKEFTVGNSIDTTKFAEDEYIMNLYWQNCKTLNVEYLNEL